jgi:hypothetical protein
MRLKVARREGYEFALKPNATRAEEKAMMDAIRSCLTRLGELTTSACGSYLTVPRLIGIPLRSKGQSIETLRHYKLKLMNCFEFMGEAKTELTQIDREQPEEIEEHRKQMEREDRSGI